MAKKINTLKSANFMAFGVSKPIPQPIETTKNNREWVLWGEDNLYPQFLLRLYYESAYNNGIIKQKANYLTAKGFEVIGEPEDKRNAVKLFKNGTHQMDFNEVLEHCTFDLVLFDAFALKVTKSINGGFAHMEPVPVEQLRVSEDKTRFFVSNNWKKSTPEVYEYSALDWSDDKQSVGIFYYHAPSKDYELPRNLSATNVYSKPEYLGAVKDILSDIEISGYHYYELVNGMKAGTLITFTNGEPEPTERANIEHEFKTGLTPNENAGGIMLHFVDTPEQKPDVQNLNGNDLDKRYLMTANAVKEKIFVGHGITTPALFGVSTPGQLGQKTELLVGFQIFVKTWVRKKQMIIEQNFNYLFAELGFGVAIKLNEPEPPFATNDLQTNIATPQPTQLNAQNNDEQIITRLSQCGIDASTVKIIARKDIKQGNEQMERDFMAMHQTFALPEVEAQLLKLFGEGESVESIAKALAISTNDVVKLYNKLRLEGYILNGELTAKAINEINQLTPFRVLYEYTKRADVSGADIIEGSRNFCRAIIGLKRLYTREEIDSLNALTPHGESAWYYRGGWYNNNGKNEFGCRHTWSMVLVEK
jgi:DNA-binding CsgD family transcriptional regulator